MSEIMSAGTVVKLYNSPINFIKEINCSFKSTRILWKLKNVQQFSEKDEARPKRGVKRTRFLDKSDS